MPAPLVILAPSLAPAVGSAVGIGLGGSLIYGAAAVDQFRRGPAGLPPLTGLENEPTLQEKIADYFASARVGVASPEPPKLPGGAPGPGGAVVAGVAGIVSTAAYVAGQLWGQLNGRPRDSDRVDVPIGEVRINTGLLVDAPIVISVFNKYLEATSYGTSSGTTEYEGTTDTTLPAGVSVSVLGSGGVSLRVDAEDPGPKTWQGVTAVVTKSDGSQTTTGVGGGGSITHRGGLFTTVEATTAVVGASVVGVPLPLLTGRPSGFVVPEVEPQTRPDRRPMAPPLAPPAPPLTPELPPAPREPFTPGTPPPLTPSPQPPGTPGPSTPAPGPGQPAPGQVPIPGQPPAPVPPGFPAPSVPGTGAVPRPGPLIVPQIPGSQPTGPDGLVQTRPQPGPTTTRPGTEVIGGIAIPNRPPAPTLTGIAAEVGRIEQKIAVQLRQPDPPGLELLPLVEQILEALQASEDEGTFELGGPCEKDSEGQPIAFEDTLALFSWGGQPSALANLASRIEALAEMIQYHKLLRQPTCSGAPPPQSGEWVTVNFEQVES